MNGKDIRLKIDELLDEYPGSLDPFDLSVVVPADKEVEFGEKILSIYEQGKIDGRNEFIREKEMERTEDENCR